jgi:hypothetical protein
MLWMCKLRRGAVASLRMLPSTLRGVTATGFWGERGEMGEEWRE